eukprot:TRINITY_DN6504_c0_g1_i1.p1 TRINITY_DN6504_c0_g1~~TRINITY_DN6504_c0_g1_i1.p1  ORF type:complete len:582 (-),score=143.85 TRINITY_DN6504_c0_g1_i1:6-1751(-)
MQRRNHHNTDTKSINTLNTTNDHLNQHSLSTHYNEGFIDMKRDYFFNFGDNGLNAHIKGNDVFKESGLDLYGKGIDVFGDDFTGGSVGFVLEESNDEGDEGSDESRDESRDEEMRVLYAFDNEDDVGGDAVDLFDHEVMLSSRNDFSVPQSEEFFVSVINHRDSVKWMSDKEAFVSLKDDYFRDNPPPKVQIDRNLPEDKNVVYKHIEDNEALLPLDSHNDNIEIEEKIEEFEFPEPESFDVTWRPKPQKKEDQIQEKKEPVVAVVKKKTREEIIMDRFYSDDIYDIVSTDKEKSILKSTTLKKLAIVKVELPYNNFKSVIVGKGGKTINYITKTTNTTIQWINNFTISIRGRNNNVKKALNHIKHLVQKNYKTVIKKYGQYARLITSHNGELLKQFTAGMEARIKLIDGDIIILSYREDAKTIKKRISEKFKNVIMKTLSVRPHTIRLIKKFAHTLESRTGTIISIEPQETVKIIGTTYDVSEAEIEVKKWDSSVETKYLYLLNRSNVSAVIGPKGATIKKIKAESHLLELQLTPWNYVLELTGIPSQMDYAIESIKQVLSTSKEDINWELHDTPLEEIN